MSGEDSPFDVPPAAFGRYRVLHHIGAGSLGPVFRAEDSDSGHAVLVHVLRLTLSADRAKQIATALGALGKRLPPQGVVAGIVDAGLHDGAPYYVTPFVPGDSLDAALREYGPAAIVDALPRLRALAAALEASSAFGIWHGALRPRDIIVSADDTALTGLGVAPLLEQHGVKVPALAPYTAPEIREGHKSSAASDQFALAAIAHEWLFGRAIAGPADTVIDVPTLPGMDPEQLAAAFTSALASRPTDRFVSAAAFVNAIAGAVRDREVIPLDVPVQARATTVALPFVPPDADLRRSDVEPVAAASNLHLDEAPVEELPLAGEAEDVAEEPAPFWRGSFGEQAAPASDESRRFGARALALMLAIGLVVGAAAGYWKGTSDRVTPATGAADPTGREYTDAPVATADPAGAPSTTRSRGAAGPASEAQRAANAPPAIQPDVIVSRPLNQGSPIASSPRKPLDSQPLAQGRQGGATTDRAATAPPAATPVAPRVSTIKPSAPAASVPARGETAARPRPTPGRILVRTTPAGAHVTIDGVARGETPVAVRDLALGTHTVVIAAEGRQSVERRVTLTADRPSRSIEERLAEPVARAAPASAPPETGALQIESRPVGARVTVNNRPMGATPLTLPSLSPGTYVVRLERAGYRPWSTTVQIAPGQRARVAASLEGGRSQE